MARNLERIIVTGLLLLAVTLSFIYILSPELDFDADEAIVGLMALHTTRGHLPAYFYGQGYMGSLEALAATFYFFLFGVSVSSLKLAPLTFYILFLLVQYKLIRDYQDRPHALLTLLLTVVFSPIIILWATKARGGFTATLFWGTLSYYLFFKTMDTYFRGKKRGGKWVLLLGLAAGIGWWNCAMVIYYFIPLIFATGILSRPSLRTTTQQLALARKSGQCPSPAPPRKLRVVFTVLFCILAVYITAGLVSIILDGYTLHLGKWTIRSHHGVRDINRGLGIALLTFIGWRIVGVGIRQFPGMLKQELRIVRKNYYLNAILTVGFIYLLVTGGINIYFHALPDYEFGHYQHYHRVTILKNISRNIHLIFVTLLPYLTSISTSLSSKTISGRFCGLATAIIGISSIIFGLLKVISGLRLKPFRISLTNLLNKEKISTFFLISFSSCLFLVTFSVPTQDSTSFRYLISIVSWLPFFSAALGLYLWTKLRWGGLIFFVVLIACSLLKISPVANLYKDYLLNPKGTSNNQKLIKKLHSENVTRAFADYWTAYPLTFLTQEEIIVAPYFSMDRYPPYTAAVKSSKIKAYLFPGSKFWGQARRLEKKLIYDKLNYERKFVDQNIIFIVRE